MDKSKAKFLILVEGSRVDARLMERLFQLYGIDTKYEIVSYSTNIKENRNHDYSKFAVTRGECNIVIGQNIEKGWYLLAVDSRQPPKTS